MKKSQKTEEKVRLLAKRFKYAVFAWHGREHYQYQIKIAEAVISAIIRSQKGETIEIPIELPRQSGKTTAVVDLVEFILAIGYRVLGRPLSIGIFAPQREQATTDFDRLKLQLEGVGQMLSFKSKISEKKDLKIPQKWNSKTIRLFDNAGKFLGEVYIFPLSKTSNPESKTFDVIIIEETQGVNDDRMKNAVFPMGAATNAPRIYIGTAGYRLCYYKKQLDENPNAIVISLEEVFKQRREMYEKTGDERHLLYESFVNHEIKANGIDNDYIQTQYFLKWIIGAGQFATKEELDALLSKRGLLDKNDTDRPCYVGIDTAKMVDRTVLTVLRDQEKDPQKSDLIFWLSLKGDNYEDQFDIIKKALEHFKQIRCIAIDATGQGDFMPDKFERHTRYNVKRVKFSAETKDVLYKDLMQVVKNKLTTVPNIPENPDFKQWFREMINLQKEYKGRFMSVHHPDTGEKEDQHDDYADSWALAEHAKNHVVKNTGSIRFV